MSAPELSPGRTSPSSGHQSPNSVHQCVGSNQCVFKTVKRRGQRRIREESNPCRLPLQNQRSADTSNSPSYYSTPLRCHADCTHIGGQTVSFAYRLKEDGIDLICPRCFNTVGTAEREEDLERFERGHICDPILLERASQMLHPQTENQRSRKWLFQKVA